jgi:hypothetical protein
MGETRHAYIIFAGKHLGKRVLRKQKSSYEDNIKMDVKDIGCAGGMWVRLSQHFCGN